MTGLPADPDFPNRPTHRDFAALSRLVIGHDEDAQRIEIDAIMARYGDVDSISYMAIMRSVRACIAHGLPVEMGPEVAALWVDGFCLGAAFQQNRPRK